MRFQCNIDSRGKAARLVWGLLCITLGVILLFAWALPTGGAGAWVAVASILGMGVLGLVEGWAGWCIVRAMGIKTRY